MSSTNKMLRGMVIGAALGAAVSLFDKDTRASFIENSKTVGKKTAGLLKNPRYYAERVKEQVDAVRNTFEEVSEDIRFITGKVNELTDTTPKVLDLLKDTKETFSHNSSPEREDNREVK